MTKIAASGAIRENMPTPPREGRAIECRHRVCSFVFPIGVFGMFEVPQRPPTLHLRNGPIIVFRGRRGGGPLQGPCVPWVAARWLAPDVRPDQVHQERQDTRGLEEHPDGDDEDPGCPSS